MPDYRHAGTFWPANAGGEHPDVATILGLPGSGSLVFVVADSARYWWRQIKGRAALAVWRGLPRPDRLPAMLGWDARRVAEECTNLWDEAPHSGTEWFTPLNELQFRRESGEDWKGYTDMASKLSRLRLALRGEFGKRGQEVRLLFPAWVPGDDIIAADQWLNEAWQWDGIRLHAYNNADEIRARYVEYRQLLGPDVPILVDEYNANHTGADERAMVQTAAEICAADPKCLGWTWYIWETNNGGEHDLSIWGNPDRLSLFSNPPTVQPAPEPIPVPDYRAMTRAAAAAQRLDVPRFERQIGVESLQYNLDVIECRIDSPAGARGIAQLMPVHWGAVDPCNPPAALAYAVGLMRGHLDYWQGRGYMGDAALGLALASYNAGRQATIDGLAGRKAGWPFKETVTYLVKILDLTEAAARTLLATGTLDGGTVASIKLSDVLARARSRTGDPYVWDGEQPGGFDCSGLIKWAYNGALTSFTDAIFDQTQRVETPAPGDIVLYAYSDPDQPGVKFPHTELFLSDTRVFGARFGVGVGEHDQLPRTKATRYYRRAPNVIVDTLDAPPAPAPSPSSEYSVGPGILAAMQAHGDQVASDEVYVKSGNQDAWSEAMGRSGAMYRYLPATGAVYRYDPAA